MEGLDFLHQKGIAHRDIKPVNLTVRSYNPPDAQIIDFGCASFQSPILYDHCGTIPYLAPEQKEREYHTVSADLWAMALVGSELMGYKKAVHDKVNEVAYQTIHQFLTLNSKHPLASCCKEMLQYKAQDRMSAADALKNYLVGYMDEIEPETTGKRSVRHSSPEGRTTKRS